MSLSIGYVTTEDRGRESLEDLLAKADKAMYEHKKLKKLPTRRTAPQTHESHV